MNLLKTLILLTFLTKSLSVLSQNTNDSITISKKAITKIYKEIKVCEKYVSSYNGQKILTQSLIENNLKKINEIQVKNIKIDLHKIEIQNLQNTNQKINRKLKRQKIGLPIIAILSLGIGVLLAK